MALKTSTLLLAKPSPRSRVSCHVTLRHDFSRLPYEMESFLAGYNCSPTCVRVKGRNKTAERRKKLNKAKKEMLIKGRT